jgi:hypothetical protein
LEHELPGAREGERARVSDPRCAFELRQETAVERNRDDHAAERPVAGDDGDAPGRRVHGGRARSRADRVGDASAAESRQLAAIASGQRALNVRGGGKPACPLLGAVEDPAVARHRGLHRALKPHVGVRSLPARVPADECPDGDRKRQREEREGRSEAELSGYFFPPPWSLPWALPGPGCGLGAG